jgi:hypothetical protein
MGQWCNKRAFPSSEQGEADLEQERPRSEVVYGNERNGSNDTAGQARVSFAIQTGPDTTATHLSEMHNTTTN